MRDLRKPRFGIRLSGRALVAVVLCLTGVALAILGTTDVNLVTGTETYPHITQDETSLWGHGNTVVAVYNDSREITQSPINICGVSVSTNGGTSFTRVTPSPFTGLGECFGNPSVFYSVHAAKWFASFGALSSPCGTTTATGVGQWESVDGTNWSASGCVVVQSGDSVEIPTTWVDNNAGSPFFGRQYAALSVSVAGNSVPQVRYSSDDGVTWSNAVNLPLPAGVASLLAVKITGSLAADGTVFVEAMHENAAGFHETSLDTQRMNYIYRSTNGGVNWSAAIQQGPAFYGPGRALCSDTLRSCMYTSPNGGYWRDFGWGQPGVGPNGVVHYVYTASPAAGGADDPGNIFYIRSTDRGSTWSTPLQLNTDATTRAQWGPSLSVNAQGLVFVSWYDERNTTDDTLERFGRASTDNGATWGTESAISDVIFPKPLQPDGNIYASYVGLYNHAAFSNDGYGNIAYHGWTDGRVSINGAPQQDVFFDQIAIGSSAVPTFVVTTVADHDDGNCNAADCTLREAIIAANAKYEAVINFAPGVTGVIQLSAALPAVANNVSLHGPGANLLTVRRNVAGAFRIFNFSFGTGSSGPTASIDGLTIADGNVIGTSFDGGGGILNDHGTLTLTNCSLSGNTAHNGGAIYNSGFTPGRASLTIKNCTLSGNSADAGGGIFNNGGQSNAALTIINSTLSGNTATNQGGAISNVGALGNDSAALTNCTVSGNSAPTGGGIYSSAGFGGLTLANNIFKSGATGANLENNSGTIVSLGHNLSNDAAGGPGGSAPGGFLNAAGDIRNTDPQLGSLVNNGGPTQTYALLPGSAAINAGDDAFAPKLDQRGYVRLGVSDIGAFEFGGTPVRITSITRLANGHIVLQGLGVPNGVHTLHSSPDLNSNSFNPIDTVMADAAGALQYDDAGAVGLTKRFYRLSFP
jgi:CSLREA domain-containing protein